MIDFLDVFTLWEGWLYLFILSVLEIVLGIDNIIFISIVTDKLKGRKRSYARNIGLSIALIMRLLLLSLVSSLMSLKQPLFCLFDTSFSGQSIILILGGLFLIYKSTVEMHNNINNEIENKNVKSGSLSKVITQIVLIDLVFSFVSYMLFWSD